MRAKTVGFERDQKPIDSLNIGKNRTIKKGDTFIATHDDNGWDFEVTATEDEKPMDGSSRKVNIINSEGKEGRALKTLNGKWIFWTFNNLKDF